MIESVDLDVVDINMAWEGDLSVTRVEVVEYAAAEGIHVLIAKPLAETWEQCTQIVEAAVRGKVKFAMDLNINEAVYEDYNKGYLANAQAGYMLTYFPPKDRQLASDPFVAQDPFANRGKIQSAVARASSGS